MFLWSRLLRQVVGHISVSISGLLSCSAYENAPNFVCPKKSYPEQAYCCVSFLFSACYMEWLWSLVNFASNHFLLNLSPLSQKMHKQIIFALQLMDLILLYLVLFLLHLLCGEVFSCLEYTIPSVPKFLS